ncbi:MAG: hypothetical protein RBS96_07455, partial [Dehalococcoidales bacterium]|nr:hypothetical protein [Dehalococcoidales bacterium]
MRSSGTFSRSSLVILTDLAFHQQGAITRKFSPAQCRYNLHRATSFPVLEGIPSQPLLNSIIISAHILSIPR